MEILTERDAKVLYTKKKFMPMSVGGHEDFCDFAAFTHEGNLVEECFFTPGVALVPSKTYNPSVESVLKAEYLDEIFLAHSSQWSGNFQHFMIELLPKLMNYRKNILGVRLMPSPESKNNFFMDICNLIGIPRDIILFPQLDSSYNVKSLHFCGWEANMNCTEYTFNALKSFNQICKSQSKESDVRKVYISRNNEDQDFENNNNQTGNNRLAANEKEFIDQISLAGFNTLHMASKRVEEKISLLSSVETLLVPDGASSMNALFARNLKNVIILDTGLGDTHFLFTKLLIQHVFPECKVDYIKSDRPTGMQIPFHINTKAIARLRI
jgi:capsular polysaccharide biosynthesis protein